VSEPDLHPTAMTVFPLADYSEMRIQNIVKTFPREENQNIFKPFIYSQK
jgi:hypothetical protein